MAAEIDYQHHFELDVRRAHPSPGVPIFIKAGTEELSYTVKGFPMRSTILHGIPYLPTMGDKEMGQLLGWSSRGFPPILEAVNLKEQYRSFPPSNDELLRLVWRDWENFILRCARGTKEIATPAKPLPGYEKCQWQDFLEYVGYRPTNGVYWRKRV